MDNRIKFIYCWFLDGDDKEKSMPSFGLNYTEPFDVFKDVGVNIMSVGWENIGHNQLAQIYINYHGLKNE